MDPGSSQVYCSLGAGIPGAPPRGAQGPTSTLGFSGLGLGIHSNAAAVLGGAPRPARWLG